VSKKILIVDDEANIRELVRVSLEDEGFDLYEAADGKEALERARTLRPDLVILDLMMPDKWGYTVCEELKQGADTRQILVLFLTVRSSAQSKKMGQLKGGDAFLVKPFQPQDLKQKVKELLGV
jgi:two-component system alkaline phosphatase synthesis response regulator PhoP